MVAEPSVKQLLSLHSVIPMHTLTTVLHTSFVLRQSPQAWQSSLAVMFIESRTISSERQMKHLSLSSIVGLYWHGVEPFGLQPQPVGGALFETSTPPQTSPMPGLPGHSSFCKRHIVPRPTQLFAAIPEFSSQHEVFMSLQNPHPQSRQKASSMSSGMQAVFSGQISSHSHEPSQGTQQPS